MKKKKIKCLLTRKFWDLDLEYLRTHVMPDVVFVIPKDYSIPTLAEEASRGIDILLGDVPAPEVMDAATGVKLLQIPWTGLDKIDFGLLEKYSFQVCNSHSNAASVAELAMALLLACMKQIPSHHCALKQGNWRRPGSEDFTPPDALYGKDIGLIGYGAVGRKLEKMLKGFDVTIRALASDGRKEGELAILGPDGLNHLFKRCDVLIVTAPLTPATRGMIGREQLELMKSTSYLINVSRGDIIDEESLFCVLKENRIAGAGIDVWYQYPQRGHSLSRPSRFPFETLGNVVMSPHRGGMIRGELPHLPDAVENLNRFATGRPLINRVDFTKGY